jgi:hypothetical protein
MASSNKMKTATKTILVVMAIATTTKITFAQTPYDDFAPSGKTKEMLKLPEATFTAYNEDATSSVKYVELDKETLTLKYFGKDSLLIAKTQLQPNDFKWLSVDPLTNKYPNYSPYVAFANNPVYYVDPDGRKFVNFDANGNYTGTTKDNWFHNTFFGTKGRVLDASGNATQKFRFADPTNDVNDIQNGTITKLVFVTEKDVRLMVARSGGFDHDNKTENRSWGDRYSYIQAEGIGGGKMDFSYTQIPKVYPNASTDPLNTPSPLIFLTNGVAHNQMNFGNFLFGASGEAQGFTKFELQMGAHYNSVANSTTNGYTPQLDSKDDQLSIKEGFKFGKQNQYDKKEFKVTVGPATTAP